MKALVIIVTVLGGLAGCPRTLSETDRAALQDFRVVERDCLAREAEILRDESMRMTDADDLATLATERLLVPWKNMRTRLAIEERKLGDELATLLRRYLDERELAWTALPKTLARQWTTPTENHRWTYRENTDAAIADKKRLDAKLAALKLPALPSAPTPSIVELSLPPPVTTPGAAYFLANRSVVRLDDRGFRVIATDVDSMDVLPDGTMWACSIWHIAYWDGTTTADYKPKLPSDICSAAPNGDLWVLQDRYYDPAHDLLGRFDRKRWTIVPANIGAPDDKTKELVVDRDGHLYARVSSRDSGDHIYVLDKAWRTSPLPYSATRPRVESIVRGADGRVWATYDVEAALHGGMSTAIVQLGGDTIALTDKTLDARPFVDAAGVVTAIQPRANALVQGPTETKPTTMPMPMPIARRGLSAGVAIDGAGRIWIDLVDGVSVIERGGKRTVYPRGSIPGITESVRAIAVTGAGPTLVPPDPVAARSIRGQIRGAGKVELAMCGDPYASECPPGLPVWTTYSDAEGAFTFENVPRWSLDIVGLTGLSGEKYWRRIEAACCADKDDLGEVRFEPSPVY